MLNPHGFHRSGGPPPRRGRRHRLASADAPQWAIALKPDAAHAHATLAQVYSKQDKPDLAREEWTRAISKDPNRAHFFRGRAEVELGRPDTSPARRAGAIGDLDRAIGLERPEDLDDRDTPRIPGTNRRPHLPASISTTGPRPRPGPRDPGRSPADGRESNGTRLPPYAARGVLHSLVESTDKSAEIRHLLMTTSLPRDIVDPIHSGRPVRTCFPDKLAGSHRPGPSSSPDVGAWTNPGGKPF
jgi:hypothetical protein